MNRLSFLLWTSGGQKDPSARLRALCYQEELSKVVKVSVLCGFSILKSIKQPSFKNIKCFAKIFCCKTIFLQRRVPPFILLLFWRMMKRKIIFDVDDGIHLYLDDNGHELGLRLAKVAKYFDLVIVGNKALSHVWEAWNDNVVIIPTAVDINENIQKKKMDNNEMAPLIWIGTSSNFVHLNTFLSWYLLSDLQNELIICSNVSPKLIENSKKKITFIEWSDEVECMLAKYNAIGIMPLNNCDDTSQFKCSFKMLQYMSWGIPVIVTPIGMNAEIIDMAEIGFAANSVSEWKNAIKKLSLSNALFEQQGEAGKLIAKSFYSRQVVCDKLKAEICKIIK